MNTIECLNKAIDYIEKNIENELEIDKIAEVGTLSKFHFQRIFHVVTGFTVAQYIRNRRLTLAAEKLAMNNLSVTEVAVLYGYESIDAFTKAFKRLHGVTPMEVKKGNVSVQAFPRLSLQLSIKGKEQLVYRIVEREPFDVFGLVREVKFSPTIAKDIMDFYNGIWDNGIHSKLVQYLGYDKGHLLDGIHFDFEENDDRKYMIGAEKNNTQISEDLGEEIAKRLQKLHIDNRLWAVFEYHADMSNPIAIDTLWRKIYVEWMPSANIVQVEGPCIEKYCWEDEEHYKYYCEVWMPVRRKKCK